MTDYLKEAKNVYENGSDVNIAAAAALIDIAESLRAVAGALQVQNRAMGFDE